MLPGMSQYYDDTRATRNGATTTPTTTNHKLASNYSFRVSDIREDFERHRLPKIKQYKNITKTPKQTTTRTTNVTTTTSPVGINVKTYNRERTKKNKNNNNTSITNDDDDDDDEVVTKTTIDTGVESSTFNNNAGTSNNNNNNKKQKQQKNNSNNINFYDSDHDFVARFVQGSFRQYLLRQNQNEQHQNQNQQQQKNQQYNQQQVSNNNNSTNKNILQIICQEELLLCQGTIDDHLDLFTQCRMEPLSFLPPFLRDANNRLRNTNINNKYNTNNSMQDDTYDDNDYDCTMNPGAYTLSKECEYCGCTDINKCNNDCTRPKLYFQKKRQPFTKPDRILWDPTTDYYIDR